MLQQAHAENDSKAMVADLRLHRRRRRRRRWMLNNSDSLFLPKSGEEREETEEREWRVTRAQRR